MAYNLGPRERRPSHPGGIAPGREHHQTIPQGISALYPSLSEDRIDVYEGHPRGVSDDRTANGAPMITLLRILLFPMTAVLVIYTIASKEIARELFKLHEVAENRDLHRIVSNVVSLPFICVFAIMSVGFLSLIHIVYYSSVGARILHNCLYPNGHYAHLSRIIGGGVRRRRCD